MRLAAQLALLLRCAVLLPAVCYVPWPLLLLLLLLVVQ
jgi:hypothetical protein